MLSIASAARADPGAASAHPPRRRPRLRTGGGRPRCPASSADDEGDTIYAVDRVAEDVLIEEIARTMATEDAPVVLVAEGLTGGAGWSSRKAPTAPRRSWAIIVDPIDGTRGLMYQKRPAWILTGVAAGPGTAHARRHRARGADRDSAGQAAPVGRSSGRFEGRASAAVRVNRLTGDSRAARSARRRRRRPSRTALRRSRGSSRAIAPSSRRSTTRSSAAVLGPPARGKAQSFEDQYISTGGQLYELMAGHDRFVADLRPLFERRSPGRRRRCVVIRTISARSSSRASLAYRSPMSAAGRSARRST